MRCEQEGPAGVHLDSVFFLLRAPFGQYGPVAAGVHLDSEVGWVKRMHLCIEGSIRIAYRKIVVFYLASHSIAVIALLDVHKVTNRATTGSKKSVYLNLLSRWLTNKVIILHSSSSKIAKKGVLP